MSDAVSLVTGGSGGLGRAVVAALLERGDAVVVPWVVERELDGLRALLDERAIDTSRLALVEADVTDAAGMEALVSKAGTLGALRNAVLLVGGFAMGPLEATGRDAWDRLVQLNATSVFESARAVIPVLRSNGGGSIVTVTAPAGLGRSAEGMAAYGATKAAVASLTGSLAKEGRPDRIRANAIAPDVIDTPANRAAMPDADPSEWLTPDQIAGVISFLTSDAGSVVSGAILTLTRS